jgi:CheY-like chemotaxis protein
VTEKVSERVELPAAVAATIHDTTNALTVVLGWIERAASAETGRADALARASHHAHWARDRLRGMLGEDATTSTAETSATTLSVLQLIERTRDDLVVEAERAHVGFDCNVDQEVRERFPRAPTAAWQVLTNLLLNALAASPPSGRVEIRARKAGRDSVCIEVLDDGPGIPLERRATLFSSGESTRSGGAGVGLRASSVLALEQGGRIELVEDARHGATFAVDWPLLTAAPSRTVSGLRVLLLEDDPAIVELLELGFRGHGADVTAARDLPALEALLTHAPCDVLLVDLSPLVGTDGEGDAESQIQRLASLARSRNGSVTVLAISGSVARFASSEVLWLRKPFTTGELLDAIGRSRPD